MFTSKKLDCFAAGLAIFAMFFGAGNIIFPLALGQIALNKTPFALIGLLLTAVLMPFIGLMAMVRYQGKIRLFFSRLGKIPGLILATLIILLLGPLGAAPRCLSLAHSTLSLHLPSFSIIWFSALASVIIFIFTYRKSRLLSLFGYILSPLKITLLAVIVVKGWQEASQFSLSVTDKTGWVYFYQGLIDGYKTMDLLAAFFFAPVIMASLNRYDESRSINRFMISSCIIGAILLSIVYIGFCMLAYFYAKEMVGITTDKLLGVMALKILGPNGGFLMSLTMTFACLTTAIALLAAFANFIHKELFKEKVGYIPILIGTLVITFIVTTLNFQGIAQFLNPILEVGYPLLILLTIYNLIAPIPEPKKIFVSNRGEIND